MFKLISLAKRTIRAINSLEEQLTFTQRAIDLENKSLVSSEPIIGDERLLTSELIVSLTTYGARIFDVHLVIESIARQTIKPNKIILWLDEAEFTNEDLPIVLKKQMDRGLEVRFCKNYRSYKKIVPTLNMFPDAYVVTIDDDIIYPFDLIERLVKTHRKHPNIVIGCRAHKITKLPSGKLAPYLNWQLSSSDTTVGHDVFLTTGAGTLFPPAILPKETVDESLFGELCPNADDVWIKVMLLKNDVKCGLVDRHRRFDQDFKFIPFNQSTGLSIENVHNHENDAQLKRALAHFNLSFSF